MSRVMRSWGDRAWSIHLLVGQMYNHSNTSALSLWSGHGNTMLLKFKWQDECLANIPGPAMTKRFYGTALLLSPNLKPLQGSFRQAIAVSMCRRKHKHKSRTWGANDMHDLANVQPCCVTLLYILRQTLSNQDVTLIAVQEHSAIQFGVQKPGKNSVKPTSQLWHLQLPFADSCRTSQCYGSWHHLLLQ